MPETICNFTEAGIEAFTKWFRESPQGDIPPDLISDPRFSVPVCEAPEAAGQFSDRYQFGCWLAASLQALDSRQISYDQFLWSWLAARFFDQLCPKGADGKRILRKEYVYIPTVPRLYYRHLVRTPWFLVHRHGEAARFLLIASESDPAPLSRQSYLLDQLAARQFVIASPTLIAAATNIFVDPRSGRPRRGAGSKGKGSPRRLALIANQLSLTYDIHEMPVERFLKLLPDEFSSRW